MPTDRELNTRDTKLVTWLGEAHAKEAELEADLTAHIALTEKASYKKRLQQHLKETREHKRATAKRIRELGGEARAGRNVPGVPNAIGVLAHQFVVSAPHFRNMIDPAYTQMGVGVARSPDGTIWVAEEFAQLR